MKNKKPIIIFFVIIVLLLLFVVIITAGKKGNNNVGTENQGVNQELNLNLPNNSGDDATTTELIPTVYDPEVNEQAPALIVVNGDEFSPKTITAPAGSKINLVFRASDEAEHRVVFEDKILSYIDLKFSKVGGDKTILFPAPAPGSYSFYIDESSNKGELVTNSK